jgi:hypothetical protein
MYNELLRERTQSGTKRCGAEAIHCWLTASKAHNWMDLGVMQHTKADVVLIGPDRLTAARLAGTAGTAGAKKGTM